jgi:hypothetical protein
MLLCCLAPLAGLSRQAKTGRREVPTPYLRWRDQAGHELVKTEEFVVPVGATVVIKGLEFDGPACSLTSAQERILTQVFFSLEEITENTVNDTDPARAAGRASAFAGEPVTFNGRASSDPDRNALTLTWAFDDGDSATGL